nr:acyloxyacyl hydrolase [uncultured Pseudomonas sp.]
MNKPMMRLAAFAALSMTAIGAAHAADMTVAVGQSGESTMVYRLGAQFDFNRSWWQSGVGRLTGYWDAGYTFWEGDETSSNHSLSFAPVFVYEFAGEKVKPYVEAGIGVAAFADTRLEDNDLGSSFQFEDRIGFGVRFAKQEIGVRAIHYSNAGLKQPNDGIEAYMLHYRMSF